MSAKIFGVHWARFSAAVVFAMPVALAVAWWTSPGPGEAPPAAEPPATARPSKSPAEIEEGRRFQAGVAALRRLRAATNNPESFRVEQVIRLPNGTLCVTYRGTNAFGGIVPGHAIVTNERVTAGADIGPRWSRTCAGRDGKDVTYMRQSLL